MRSTNHKILNYFFYTIIITVLVSHFIYDIKFKTSIIQTGIYELPISLKPLYGFLPVPGPALQSKSIETAEEMNPVWKRWGLYPSQTQSPGALGADFSQVYLSALALRHGESQYDPKSPRFKRNYGKSSYPPIMNRLYTLLTYFPYYIALTIHNYGTLLIFLIISALLFVKFNLQRYIAKIIVIVLLLYFYTPAGFAHFERGQFELIVTSSYLLLFSCIFLDTNFLFPSFASGFFGALKWSSVPFIGTFSVMAFIGSKAGKRWTFLLPGFLIILSVLLFYREIIEYWPTLKLYEFQVKPSGISFMTFLPRAVAKTLQIVSCLPVIFLTLLLYKDQQSRSHLFILISFPFALTMFIQGMGFNTLSYEYRIVSMFALIPAFVIWLEKADAVSIQIKGTIAAFFALFIIVSFRVFYFLIWDLPTMRSPGMSAFYLMSSIFCLLLTCYLIYANRNMESIQKTTTHEKTHL